MAKWASVVFLIISVEYVHSVGQSDACPVNSSSFGPDCEYQCHCRDNQRCDASNGSCGTNNDCEDGYAGNSCQYINLARDSTVQAESLEIVLSAGNKSVIDGKVNTCVLVQRTPNTSWLFSLSRINWVTDIQLRFVTDTAEEKDFFLTYNDNNNDLIKIIQDTRWILYRLPQPTLVSKVEIRKARENVSLSLCEIAILGGREMTLKKNISEGHATGHDTGGGSVDGVTDQSHSQTSEGTSRTWCKVLLGKQQHVWRVQIFHRGHLNASQLSNFHVSITFSNGSNQEVYWESSHYSDEMIDLVFNKSVQGTELTLWKFGKETNVSWCDIRVIGDCMDGFFGWRCEETCQCQNSTEICNNLLGTCLSTECRPGWKGKNCQEVCSPGSYGLGCSNMCNVSCGNQSCDHVTGVCNRDCDAGGVGIDCTRVCKSGFYGNNCSQSCHASCVNSSCDPNSGRCLHGCLEGVENEWCDTVSTTSVSNVTTGATTSLPASSASTSVIGVIVSVVVVALLLSLILCGALRCRNPRTGNHNHNNSLSISGSTNLLSKRVSGRSLDPYEHVDLKLGTRSNLGQTSFSPEIENEKPIKKRPELLSLFSRDASQNPPLSAEYSPFDNQPLPSPLFPMTYRNASFESLDALSIDDVDVVSRKPSSDSGLDRNDSLDNLTVALTSSTVTDLSSLPNKVANWLLDPRLFAKERSMLPSGQQAEWETAILPENIKKNRYRNIYPYDCSRVILAKLPGNPHSDFYNACYIDGYESRHQYVAAQGPIERTLDDFIRMVWELKTSRIIMLTNTEELGRVKCFQYWPKEGSLAAGEIKVTIKSTQSFADYCIRELNLEKRGECHTVTQFHFTGWPDNYAPASPWSLLDFRCKVNQSLCKTGPIVVHCSAGIGRTGTYLALDILLACAEREREIDVFSCVWKLRQQRVNMVQTLTQYIFIYETLVAAISTSAPVPLKDFHLEEILMTRNGGRIIDEEYAKLERCRKLNRENEGALPDNGHTENVKSHITASTHDHLVRMLSGSDAHRSTRINAVFLSNFTQERAFIQTQSPTDFNIGRFLSMVIQYDVNRIICLDTPAELEEEVSLQYWPNVHGERLTLGGFRVEHLAGRSERKVTILHLRITLLPGASDDNGYLTSIRPNEDHEITLVTCDDWHQSRLTPNDVSVLLQLAGMAMPSQKRRVLIHCRDGHTRSGLVCAAATAIERLQIESHVAVSYVTAHMRVPRPQNIVSVEQYEFIYRCVQERIALKNEEQEENDYMAMDNCRPDNRFAH